VKVDAANREEHAARAALVMKYFGGAKPDSTQNPSRFSRMPGVKRNGNMQRLIELNVGATTWEEWEASLNTDGTDWFELDDLLGFDRENDPDCLIGKRWLGVGGSFIMQGYSGIGKSSMFLQMALSWSGGRSFFGIQPKRALKIVFIQAENDKGDVAEPFQDILKYALKLSPDEFTTLKANFSIGREAAKSGAERFGAYVQSLIRQRKPDIVFADPLLSFFGDDISKQEAASRFFRHYLQPIQNETGVIFGFVHHLGKPPKEGAGRQGPSHYQGLGSSDIVNWARETITVTEDSKNVCRLEFGKRGDRTGLVDRAGNPTNELFLQRAENGKRYWFQSDSCRDSGDAKVIKERQRHEKLRAMIVELGTVTLQTLKSKSAELGIAKNDIRDAAMAVVTDSQNSEQPIHSYERRIKGVKGGPTPTIFSIHPEPEGDDPIEVSGTKIHIELEVE
jgi:hypothetical protein